LPDPLGLAFAGGAGAGAGALVGSLMGYRFLGIGWPDLAAIRSIVPS
jgi:hypothetical protein